MHNCSVGTSGWAMQTREASGTKVRVTARAAPDARTACHAPPRAPPPRGGASRGQFTSPHGTTAAQIQSTLQPPCPAIIHPPTPASHKSAIHSLTTCPPRPRPRIPRSHVLRCCYFISPLMLRAFSYPARDCAHRDLRRLATRAAVAATGSDPALIALGRSVFFGSRRAEVTFFLGPPGAGKSTLSEMACDRLGYKHVSVGELLREEIQRESEIGAEIAPIVKGGGLVPSAVSVKLLLAHLKRALQEEGVAQVDQWIVDGFPRKVSSAEVWERLGLTPKRVVGLEVDEDVMRRRLCLRGRVDDVPDVILERFDAHRREWPSIKGFYRSRGLLTLIDGNGSPEEVWQRFLGAVGEPYSSKAN